MRWVQAAEWLSIYQKIDEQTLERQEKFAEIRELYDLMNDHKVP